MNTEHPTSNTEHRRRSAHHPQIATYPKGLCDVRELRCTECRVVVETFEVRPWESPADLKRRVAAAWERHATPPPIDFQI